MGRSPDDRVTGQEHSAGQGGRALVLHPTLRSKRPDPIRTPEAKLAEAVGLACAIDLTVVHAEVARLSDFRPSTMLGEGVVERWRG